MHIMDRFPYYADNETQVLMLPYRGEQLSMCLFLPKAKFGLQEFEASLNGSRLLELIENMHTKEVRVGGFLKILYIIFFLWAVKGRKKSFNKLYS